MTANIYRRNFVTGEYELITTFHDDATVEGDSAIAERLRTAVSLIESRDEDPATWVDTIIERLVQNWDNGHYRIGWD